MSKKRSKKKRRAACHGGNNRHHISCGSGAIGAKAILKSFVNMIIWL